MSKNYVCDGAKIECQLCVNPEGTLTVTSNEIKIQGQVFANENDKGKPNLVFDGNCKKSPYQASPCKARYDTYCMARYCRCTYTRW